MSKFFVTDEVYKDRMSICKSCDHYFKLTGSCKVCKCFMKIKTRIGSMECPQRYWHKTSELEATANLPKEIQEAVLEIYPKIRLGRAPNLKVKHQMMELYNTIFNAKYDKNTGCGSCLSTVKKGMEKVYNQIKKDENI